MSKPGGGQHRHTKTTTHFANTRMRDAMNRFGGHYYNGYTKVYKHNHSAMLDEQNPVAGRCHTKKRKTITRQK